MDYTYQRTCVISDDEVKSIKNYLSGVEGRLMAIKYFRQLMKDSSVPCDLKEAVAFVDKVVETMPKEYPCVVKQGACGNWFVVFDEGVPIYNQDNVVIGFKGCCDAIKLT